MEQKSKITTQVHAPECFQNNREANQRRHKSADVCWAKRSDPTVDSGLDGISVTAQKQPLPTRHLFSKKSGARALFAGSESVILFSSFCLVSLAAHSLHSTKCCSLIQFASLSRSRGHPHWALTSCHTKHGSRGLERGVSVLALDKTACHNRHNTRAALRPLPSRVHIRYLPDQEPGIKTVVCHVPLVTIRLSDSFYRKRSRSIPLDLEHPATGYQSEAPTSYNIGKASTPPFSSVAFLDYNTPILVNVMASLRSPRPINFLSM